MAKRADLTSILTNLTTYEVFCMGPKGVFMKERELCDMDRKGTIVDLASGQFEDIVLIRESNIADGTVRNVTDELMAAAGLLNAEGDEPSPVDHAAWLSDHKADLRKHERVA